jgi:hypothetical protein
MLLQLEEHVGCFDLDHKTAHTCPGGRVIAPVLTLGFAPCHGQVTLSPFSLPYTQRPALVSADVLHRVEFAPLHNEERDAATVSGQPNALTGEPNSRPGGGCLTITSESATICPELVQGAAE